MVTMTIRRIASLGFFCAFGTDGLCDAEPWPHHVLHHHRRDIDGGDSGNRRSAAPYAGAVRLAPLSPIFSFFGHALAS